MADPMEPYRSTPVFDEATLPATLRADHRTKAGVWGVIRVLQGDLLLTFADGEERRLAPGLDGLLEPERTHRVEPLGSMRMQVDFYDRRPPG
jgi:hemoglobin